MWKSRRPILVTGSHRSGTTWIGRTISQHPRVRFVHEPFNVHSPNQRMGLKLDTWFTDFKSSNQKEEIITSFNNILQSRPIKYALEICKAVDMDIRTPLRFSKSLLLEYLLGSRILVKDPIALLSAGWLYETYHFKVICMIRNPFAFIGSLKEAGWDFDFEDMRKQDNLLTGRLSKFADSIEYMCMEGNESDFIDRVALLWNILHFVILEYQKQYPNWLFVKHEDVSTTPELGFQKIFDYLELDMNTEIRKYIEEYTSQRNPKDATSYSYQPRNSKLILHTWKERLSNDEIDRVKTATSDIALQFYKNFV